MPLIFHLGQFLDDLESCVWTQKQWLLAYAWVLQHTAEAHDSHSWDNYPPWQSIQLTAVVEAFMYEMGVDHSEAQVTDYWGGSPFHSLASTRVLSGPMSQGSLMN